MSIGRSPRRHFLRAAAAGAALSFAASEAAGTAEEAASLPKKPAIPGPLLARLYPQTNRFRSVLDLSGLWDFMLDPDDRGASAGWALGLPAPRQIAVPGSWNEQFEDTRDYFATTWYLRRCEIPRAWRSQRVFLRVGSANYATRVWIDGKMLGEHLGGHLPFEFDLTGMLDPDGLTTIALEVENRLLPDRVPPGGMSAPGRKAVSPDVPFDFFPYGGVHRPVLLYAVPSTHLLDVRVTTTMDGGDAVVEVIALAGEDWNGLGTVSLATPSGVLNDGLDFFPAGVATVKLRVEEPRLWQPADPYLHRLEITLLDRGSESDAYLLDFGIRTIAVDGDRLRLNGQPVLLKGLCRHEDFPVNGRGLNLPVAVKDAALIAWCGGNSFRTSHYPYADETLQIADRMGLLVIGEIPAVGLGFDVSDEILSARLEQATQQLSAIVARDANHPSVIAWSLANEPQAGEGAVAERGAAFFQALFTHVRTLDPSRPATVVSYGGSDPPWFAMSDIISINQYKGWYSEPGRLDRAADLLGQELDALHAKYGKPILLSEFGADAIAGTHAEPPAMWSEEYQVELLRRYLDVAAARPWIVGTHVWNLADFKTGQAIHRPGGINHKGVFTRDRDPKMAAHYLRSRWVTEK